jgi:Tol biopolymer transport system component
MLFETGTPRGTVKHHSLDADHNPHRANRRIVIRRKHPGGHLSLHADYNPRQTHRRIVICRKQPGGYAAGLALLLVLALTGLAGCGGGENVLVGERTPADGARGVSSRTAIRIAFSEPMMQEEVEARLRIAPPVAGSTDWAGDTLRFRPAGSLAYSQIYTVTLQAGAQSQGGRAMQEDVTWSFRTGTPRITYLAADAEESLQLYAAPLNGGPPVQLTAAEEEVWDYAVHPEGTSIAYSVLREDEEADLWIVDRDGRGARLLLKCPKASCTASAWSPDGSQIAYERIDRADAPIGIRSGPVTPHIWLLDPASGETAPLTAGAPTPGREPRWAPAGQRLAFYDLTENAVQIVDLRSGEQQFYDTFSGVGTWDPTGERMVLPNVSFHNEHGHDYLMLIEFATRKVTLLGDEGEADDTLPHWSPDGAWIALGRNRLPDGTPTWGTQLWLMRPDGSTARALVAEAEANFGAFAWRPDGGAIAYVRLPLAQVADPHPELWVVDLADGQRRQVASEAIMPGWLP